MPVRRHYRFRFYNKHHEEHVEFSKREIVDKFYSVDYGVLVANLGQIKTPIFGKRNLKDDVNEVKRLEVMSQAVGKLPPAKFMLFALHFDKYIEKLSDIDDDLMTGAIKNVVPVIKNGKTKFSIPSATSGEPISATMAAAVLSFAA